MEFLQNYYEYILIYMEFRPSLAEILHVGVELEDKTLSDVGKGLAKYLLILTKQKMDEKLGIGLKPCQKLANTFLS